MLTSATILFKRIREADKNACAMIIGEKPLGGTVVGD